MNTLLLDDKILEAYWSAGGIEGIMVTLLEVAKAQEAETKRLMAERIRGERLSECDIKDTDYDRGFDRGLSCAAEIVEEQ